MITEERGFARIRRRMKEMKTPVYESRLHLVRTHAAIALILGF